MKISRHVSHIVDPMCDATAKMLREETIGADDYVEISVEDYVYDSHDGQSVTVDTKRFVVKFKSRVEGGTPSYLIRNPVWWQKIPAAELATQFYGFTAPPTDVTALIILASLGPARLEFEDEAARLEFWTCALRFAKQTRVARAQAGFKSHRSVPNRSPKGSPVSIPMPHQKVAAWCAQRSEAYALFMEQSTGKTYTTIMTVDEAYVKGECLFNIIVAPKNVCSNWVHELKKFSKRRVFCVRLRGGKIDRVRGLLDAYRAKQSGDYDAVYVIVPYQSLVNSQEQILAFDWDWAIIDEGHYIKWYGTARTKACMKLRDKSKRRLLLTGTPIANQLFDVYSQLEFLGRGWSGFTSFYAFRKFYGWWEPTGRGVERLLSLLNVPLIKERLARCSFLIKKSEAMPDLPPKTYDMRTVEMTPEQREVYIALATQLYAEIELDIASGENKAITVTNILTRLLRLAQITSGFAVMDAEINPETDEALPRHINRFDPNPKLEDLVEFLKEQEFDSKTIVWCCFVQDIKQIAARLAIEGIKCVTYFGSTSDDARDEAVRSFNEDADVKVFIGNPSAGGVGLNLTGTSPKTWPIKCDTVAAYSQNWSAVTRAQGEERPRGFLHESVSPTGKRETWSIRCVDFVVEDSIDVQIRQRVVDKRLNAAQIQDIREILATLVTKAEETEDAA